MIPYTVKAAKENARKPHLIAKAICLSVSGSKFRLSSIGIPSKQVYINIYIKKFLERPGVPILD